MEHRTREREREEEKEREGKEKGERRRQRVGGGPPRPLEVFAARCHVIRPLTERERGGKGGYRRAGMMAERPLRRRWVAAVATGQWKMHGWSRSCVTGTIIPVPRIDFLKTKMNSEAGKSIADFIVVGIFLKKSYETGAIAPVSHPWSHRQRLRCRWPARDPLVASLSSSSISGWPLCRAPLPPFLSLPPSPFSLFFCGQRGAAVTTVALRGPPQPSGGH